MTGLLDGLLIFMVLAGLAQVGSSRLTFGVRLIALQGVTLGVLPVLLADRGVTVRLLVVAIVSVVVKGGVLPRLLFRSLREAGVRRELDPPVGYTLSLVLGVAALAFSFWLTRPERLPLPHSAASPLELPVALFTVLAGLFLIVARANALNQVLGFLLMEDGIFLFGLVLAQEEPFLIEMGVLLDVIVGVMVMGVAIFHISRTFDSIEVDQMTTLRD